MKYPRTYHLPWSETLSSDDRRIPDCSFFDGKQVVITEKLDGENCNLYGVSEDLPNGKFHARSQETSHHPSRNWIKQFLASICYQIPHTYQLCGENLFAYHSIFYEHLPSYFFAFAIFENDMVLPWQEIEDFCRELGIKTAPVIYRGTWDPHLVKSMWTGLGSYPTFDKPNGKLVDAEGYVVRIADAFPLSEFSKNVGKYVRAHHVQTDEHWMTKEVVPNRLRKKRI
jgi:hypothetical protein